MPELVAFIPSCVIAVVFKMYSLFVPGSSLLFLTFFPDPLSVHPFPLPMLLLASEVQLIHHHWGEDHKGV